MNWKGKIVILTLIVVIVILSLYLFKDRWDNYFYNQTLKGLDKVLDDKDPLNDEEYNQFLSEVLKTTRISDEALSTQKQEVISYLMDVDVPQVKIPSFYFPVDSIIKPQDQGSLGTCIAYAI
ncbi:hypothetical protein EBS02_08855, partial [bacterium]|nr:hypothetical protein [bacterium]